MRERQKNRLRKGHNSYLNKYHITLTYMKITIISSNIYHASRLAVAKLLTFKPITQIKMFNIIYNRGVSGHLIAVFLSTHLEERLESN